MNNHISKAKMNSSIALKVRRMAREKDTYERAKTYFSRHSKESFFMTGLALYWAHGAQKGGHFNFMSSDAEMVILMNTWIKKYLESNDLKPKYRLFIHQSYKNEEKEDFWAKSLGVSQRDFRKTIYTRGFAKAKKISGYKGSLSIVIGRIEALRLLIAWQKLLIKYYDEVL
ncbi:MAG: hypothetical protein V4697_03255 [Patescibacteria group bacterium]